ncbi:MAG: LPS export ABC transporter permease LptG [Gammaproteobacteria bacterium]|nr:LPS export ABC transporter permease LptG [Gammaproteobacteria bacterium]
MKQIDRYLLGGIVKGTGLVLLVLLALSSFIGFVGQVDDVGQGSYSTADAMVYVLLTLPLIAYQMAPIATLLGALLGLGNLAANSELVVMRAAGISPWRLTRSVVIAGVLLALLSAALGEFIAPPSEQYAKRFRTLSINNELSMGQGQSGWIRDGNVIVNIEQLFDEGRAGGIYVFRFAADRTLASISQARTAVFTDDGHWVLGDTRRTEFDDNNVSAVSEVELRQPTELSPSLLGLSVVDADSLAVRGLVGYIRYLRANDLNADQYVTTLWSRVAAALSIVIMAVLALPFVFGPLRSSGAGQRVFIGVLIGAAYFLGNRLVTNSGAVYGLDPVLTAWLPTLVLTALTLFAVSRVR